MGKSMKKILSIFLLGILILSRVYASASNEKAMIEHHKTMMILNINPFYQGRNI